MNPWVRGVIRLSSLVFAAATLVSCSNAGETSHQEADTSMVQAAPAECMACHTFGQNEGARSGPNLWDVHGASAASKPGFAYSSALRTSGIVWTDQALDAYLADPVAVVPGGRMSYRLFDAKRRAEVIAYLQRLSD